MGMHSSDPRPTLACDPEEGQAQQHFKAECDINNILKKYIKTGMITHVRENTGRFVDVSETGTYHEAVQRVRDTQKFFLGLPVSVRQKFDNDTSLFLDFILDPENESEIRLMGLDPLLEDEEVVEPPVVAPKEPVPDDVAGFEQP